MLTVKDLDVGNKAVLVRVDFNVPLDKQGNITDDSRIVASLPTINYLISKNAKVILVSHLGRPKGKTAEYTLAPCSKRLSELLGKKVLFATDTIGPEVEELVRTMQPGDVLLLENVRFYPAEEKPELDPAFAKSLAKLADLYVNDAFGTAHRAHSSTATVAQYFTGKKAAGFLLQKEIDFLGSLLKNPERPFFAIIGGAKVSTKIGVLKALASKVDVLMIGGAMAYTFLKAQGIQVGSSLVEDSMLETAREILALNKNIYLPEDSVTEDGKTFIGNIPDTCKGMDIGPKTAEKWISALQNAKTVLWNGPVGVFENPNFAKGTHALAKAISELSCTTIIGGGDTVAAVEPFADKFTHVSTGGGATLEFIEFGSLPGIEALST